jgi:uncharacterized protein (DUF1778 family)
LINSKNKRIKNQACLTIRCSQCEAAQIRDAAQRERRSVSAYVLRAVMNRVQIQQRISAVRDTLGAQMVSGIKDPGKNKPAA